MGGKTNWPPVGDWDFASVPERAALAVDGHAAEGGPAEVEVDAAAGAVAPGALVGDNNGDGPPGADAPVEAADLVAGSAALPVLEEHRAHSPHPSPQRPHIHQRPVPARPAFNKRDRELIYHYLDW